MVKKWISLLVEVPTEHSLLIVSNDLGLHLFQPVLWIIACIEELSYIRAYAQSTSCKRTLMLHATSSSSLSISLWLGTQPTSLQLETKFLGNPKTQKFKNWIFWLSHFPFCWLQMWTAEMTRKAALVVLSLLCSATIFAETTASSELLKTIYGDDYRTSVELPFPLRNIKLAAPAEPDSDFVFYVHMPKTAGQTFHRIIARSFRNCSLADDKCAKKQESRKTVVGPRIDMTYATKSHFRRLHDHPEMLAEEYAPYIAGLGHVDISIALAFAPRRPVFLTMLRDPMSRIFSWFNYMTSNTATVVECIRAKEETRIIFPPLPSGGIRSKKLPDGRTTDPRLEKLCNEGMTKRRIYLSETADEYNKMQIRNFDKGIMRHSADDPYIMGPNALPVNTSSTTFIEAIKKIDLDNYMTRALTGRTTRSFLKEKPKLTDQVPTPLAF